MLRPLLLLLSLQATAQTLPRDQDGHVVYKGRVGLSEVTQTQLLTRSIHYTRRLQDERMASTAPLLVDSAAFTISGAGHYLGYPSLHYELLLHLEAGGYQYELHNLATEVLATRSDKPDAPSLRSASRYVRVEQQLDKTRNYGAHHQPRRRLRAYCLKIEQQVQEVLGQLRNEMTRP